MPIKIEITADSSAELANEVQNLAGVMSNENRITAPGVISNAPAKRTRAKKDAEPAGVSNSPATAANSSDKPYTVFKADGSKFSSYADPSKAFDQLIKLVGAVKDTAELEELTSQNTDVIGALSSKQQDTYTDATDARAVELEEGAEAELLGDEELSAEDMEALFKRGLKTAGVGVAGCKEILVKLGVNRFTELDAAKYPELKKLLAAKKVS